MRVCLCVVRIFRIHAEKFRLWVVEDKIIFVELTDTLEDAVLMDCTQSCEGVRRQDYFLWVAVRGEEVTNKDPVPSRQAARGFKLRCLFTKTYERSNDIELSKRRYWMEKKSIPKFCVLSK